MEWLSQERRSQIRDEEEKKAWGGLSGHGAMTPDMINNIKTRIADEEATFQAPLLQREARESRQLLDQQHRNSGANMFGYSNSNNRPKDLNYLGTGQSTGKFYGAGQREAYDPSMHSSEFHDSKEKQMVFNLKSKGFGESTVNLALNNMKTRLGNEWAFLRDEQRFNLIKNKYRRLDGIARRNMPDTVTGANNANVFA